MSVFIDLLQKLILTKRQVNGVSIKRNFENSESSKDGALV